MHATRTIPPRGVTKPPPCCRLRIFRTFTLRTKPQQTKGQQQEHGLSVITPQAQPPQPERLAATISQQQELSAAVSHKHPQPEAVASTSHAPPPLSAAIASTSHEPPPPPPVPPVDITKPTPMYASMDSLDAWHVPCMHGMHEIGTACVAAVRAALAARAGAVVRPAEVWEVALAVASGGAMQIEHAVHCGRDRTEALDRVRYCSPSSVRTDFFYHTIANPWFRAVQQHLKHAKRSYIALATAGIGFPV